MVEALEIHVKGIVQGVGFRPFVYKLAKRFLINGWVLNSYDGVHIHAEGESQLLDEFIMEISDNAPAAAQVKEIEIKEVPLEPFDGFEIRFSDTAESEERTQVSPELATCDECANELFDPANHRYRYPFINCTNCGPRFTIIDDLPYDRKSTSMQKFVMCKTCAEEYESPVDRRFHAQPNACFECGPAIWFANFDGGEGSKLATTREESDAVFAEAVQMLLEGKILAVKGLGGYHLVCDANNPDALRLLRQRKRREGKAFAVMLKDVQDIKAVCSVSPEEERILKSAQRPIVLLNKKSSAAFAEGLANGLAELGVMLPYTPVQLILMHDFAVAHAEDGGAFAMPPMLVMTSGNIHDEPIVTDDAEALEKLSAIADGILGNNREILTRFDDSVVRVISVDAQTKAVQAIRRARGAAPQPVELGNLESNQCIFATGPEQKNTFAFLRGGSAYVSQHIGDMENAETFDAWEETKSRFEKLFALEGAAIACDMHPEYITSKWAHKLHEKSGAELVEVQHHHAHIVSAMAECGVDEAVCGVAFDGTGYGVDGAIWGGEVLIANRRAFERFINFAYMPMPGGAACIKNPLRMAYGALWAYDLLEHPGAASVLDALGAAQSQVCETMIEQGLNTPQTSSAGRLFDAVSAILGVCTEPTYDGQAACELGALAWQEEASPCCSEKAADGNADAAPEGTSPLFEDNGEGVAVGANLVEGEGAEGAAGKYVIQVVKNTATATSTAQDTSVLLFDAEDTLRGILDDKAAGVSAGVIALKFHDAIVDAIVQAAELARALYGLQIVALSGGVFMNRYIVERSVFELEGRGFTVALNRELPPNDGCISVGQAVVACEKLSEAAQLSE